MSFPKETIEKVKQAYKDEFNQDITDQEAVEIFNNLISLFKVIYRPNLNK